LTLDEAAALLADLGGPAALRDIRSTAEYNQRLSRQPASYLAQPLHRPGPMPNTPPSLGIFWAVTGSDGRTHLLTHPCALAAGERYGDCITSPAAYVQIWEAWRSGSPGPPLALLAPIIARDEYEIWPRGRIVYELTPDRFVIYADKKLLGPQPGSPRSRHSFTSRPNGPSPGQTSTTGARAPSAPVARPRSRWASLSNHKTSLEPHPQRIDKVRQKIRHCALMPGSAPPATSNSDPRANVEETSMKTPKPVLSELSPPQQGAAPDDAADDPLADMPLPAGAPTDRFTIHPGEIEFITVGSIEVVTHPVATGAPRID
jgi:hypothetical protein